MSLGVDVRRAVEHADVPCPAGQPSGDAGVYCAVEQGRIDARSSPDSVAGFCCSEQGYMECPSWRAQRDHEHAVRRHDKNVLDARRLERPERTPAQLRAERLERANALLFADTKEGARFRHRLEMLRPTPKA